MNSQYTAPDEITPLARKGGTMCIFSDFDHRLLQVLLAYLGAVDLLLPSRLHGQSMKVAFPSFFMSGATVVQPA